MANRFRDKVALVTGASAGIGAAAARQFAAEGARVALLARTRAKLEGIVADIRDAGGEAEAVPTDVRDATACATALRSVAERFGGIDVLVNNAGANRRGPVETHDAEELAAVVAVNLTAPIVLTRLALPYLRQRPSGAIVNVASIAGQVPVIHEAVYSATKFGLRAFSFALREEMEESAIRVSVVSPGPVDTGFIMDDLDEVPDLVFANPMSTAGEVAALILDSAADGTLERTIPRSTGYMAKVGNAVPALRRALFPLLSKRGAAVKQRYRARLRNTNLETGEN
jgi:short-subunit dehydrogenase